MATPAEKVEALYRNHTKELANFFNTNHREHYMIYNLNEKSYDFSKFYDRVCVIFNHSPSIIQSPTFVVDTHTQKKKDVDGEKKKKGSTVQLSRSPSTLVADVV